MEDYVEKFRQADALAQNILRLTRNTLLVNLRFLDLALSQFQLTSYPGTLATDGQHLFYDTYYVLSITERGFGKRTPVEEYRITSRGGLGIRNYMVTEKTGPIVGIKVVDGSEDLLLVTQSGILIRTPVDNIRTAGRATQGVIVMRFKEEGDQVISLALTDREETAGTQETEEGDPAGERAEEAPISEENQSEEE